MDEAKDTPDIVVTVAKLDQTVAIFGFDIGPEGDIDVVAGFANLDEDRHPVAVVLSLLSDMLFGNAFAWTGPISAAVVEEDKTQEGDAPLSDIPF